MRCFAAQSTKGCDCAHASSRAMRLFRLSAFAVSLSGLVSRGRRKVLCNRRLSVYGLLGLCWGTDTARRSTKIMAKSEGKTMATAMLLSGFPSSFLDAAMLKDAMFPPPAGAERAALFHPLWPPRDAG